MNVVKMRTTSPVGAVWSCSSTIRSYAIIAAIILSDYDKLFPKPDTS